jgi:hypothetical protein
MPHPVLWLLLFHLYSEKDVQNVCQFLWMSPIFKAGEPLRSLYTNFSLLWKGSFNHYISFCLCFLKFCTILYLRVLFFTLGHQIYDTQHKRCSSWMKIASDWMAALRSCRMRTAGTCLDTSSYTFFYNRFGWVISQTFTRICPCVLRKFPLQCDIKYWRRITVWTLFDQTSYVCILVSWNWHILKKTEAGIFH